MAEFGTEKAPGSPQPQRVHFYPKGQLKQFWRTAQHLASLSLGVTAGSPYRSHSIPLTLQLLDILIGLPYIKIHKYRSWVL